MADKTVRRIAVVVGVLAGAYHFLLQANYTMMNESLAKVNYPETYQDTSYVLFPFHGEGGAYWFVVILNALLSGALVGLVTLFLGRAIRARLGSPVEREE